MKGHNFVLFPGPRGFKWPSLGELHHALFNKGFDDAHDAAADVEATARCFLELVLLGEAKFSFPLDAKLYENPQSYLKRENYIDLVSPDRLKTSKSTETQPSIPLNHRNNRLVRNLTGILKQNRTVLRILKNKKKPQKKS